MLKKLVPVFMCFVLLAACQKNDGGTPAAPVLTDEAKNSYISLLTNIRENQSLPDGTFLEYDGADISTNRFAVCDVDSDMSPELVIEYQTASVLGSALLVYDYDSSSKAPRLQLREALGETFYDNASIKAEWPNNDGLSGELLWPYSLYKYDSQNDSYVFSGAVQAWDKSLYETSPDGTPFPDEADKDGDGILYYISEDKDNVYSASPVDYSDYETWLNSVTADANRIDPSFYYLTEENIQNLNYEESSE